MPAFDAPQLKIHSRAQHLEPVATAGMNLFHYDYVALAYLHARLPFPAGRPAPCRAGQTPAGDSGAKFQSMNSRQYCGPAAAGSRAPIIRKPYYSIIAPLQAILFWYETGVNSQNITVMVKCEQIRVSRSNTGRLPETGGFGSGL
jgi:hypothetical protein